MHNGSIRAPNQQTDLPLRPGLLLLVHVVTCAYPSALSSSFLGVPSRILNINHKKELLRGLWVVIDCKFGVTSRNGRVEALRLWFGLLMKSGLLQTYGS